MAELDLPAGPAELLESVREPLGRFLGSEHKMRLGGGTALAARWRHRHSTDVELFVRAEVYEALLKREQRFRDELELRVGGSRKLVVEPGFAHIVPEVGGEISVSTSPALTDQPVSDDLVRGTTIRLEATAEIIAKKLRYPRDPQRGHRPSRSVRHRRLPAS